MKYAFPVPIAGDAAELVMNRYVDKLCSKPGDCGIDLFPMAKVELDITRDCLGFYWLWSIPTRVNILIPEGHLGLVVGRSSSPEKLMGCTIYPGIIDHGYTGEYRVRLQVPMLSMTQQSNLTYGKLLQRILDMSDSAHPVAIAQVIILRYSQATFELMTMLPDTPRGTTAYGSTDPRS